MKGCETGLEVDISADEEFERLLKDALKRPMKWYEERVERAIRGRECQAKNFARCSPRLKRPDSLV